MSEDEYFGETFKKIDIVLPDKFKNYEEALQ